MGQTTYCQYQQHIVHDQFWALVGRHFGRNCTKKISSSSLMVGICHLTDSHHNHHGQKPTMVGICHGGNMLGNHTKPNLPNQPYQTKPTKPNLPNQTYQTKPTKPNQT